jgi:hypothetical protein
VGRPCIKDDKFFGEGIWLSTQLATKSVEVDTHPLQQILLLHAPLQLPSCLTGRQHQAGWQLVKETGL